MTKTKSHPIAIYSRVSTDSQTTENQERKLREIATRMGWNIMKVYRDEGVSGANLELRGQPSTPRGRTLHVAASIWSWHGQWTA
jgi:hypothetical protein